MDQKTAATLCAGITTFAIGLLLLVKRLAIVGLGGLGHITVKFAHPMEAEVTVLSQTLKKNEDGLGLGAVFFYATSDLETFNRLSGSFRHPIPICD